jgi:Mn2+/Fe2+ NRAMP family transporter
LQWTIALMGGIGGTVTVLCYGYWIREEGRRGAEDLRACRIDLAVAYIMTGVFGMSMIVIGSQIHVEGGGSTLIVNLADQLTTALGPAAKWAFLIGAWGAVFSSLLGVWQSVPYLFADLWNLMRDGSHRSIDRVVDTKSRPYQFYLFAIGVIPCLGLLLLDFRTTQKWNAILGAMFIPMLAVVLLILNGQSRLVGPRYRNTWLTTLVLLGALLFFLVAAWLEIKTALFG